MTRIQIGDFVYADRKSENGTRRHIGNVRDIFPELNMARVIYFNGETWPWYPSLDELKPI